MAPSQARGYLRGMTDAHYEALVIQRTALLRWLDDFDNGRLAQGEGITATPETVRYVRDEVARLTALIAEARALA